MNETFPTPSSLLEKTDICKITVWYRLYRRWAQPQILLGQVLEGKRRIPWTGPCAFEGVGTVCTDLRVWTFSTCVDLLEGLARRQFSFPDANEVPSQLPRDGNVQYPARASSTHYFLLSICQQSHRFHYTLGDAFPSPAFLGEEIKGTSKRFSFHSLSFHSDLYNPRRWPWPTAHTSRFPEPSGALTRKVWTQIMS